MTANAHKIGAVLYAVWGLLHLKASQMTYQLGFTMEDGLEQARVLQDAFNLGWIAVFAIVVALWLNWRNHRAGYWINFVVVGLVDIGFIVHVLAPGKVPMMPGVLGPVTWLLAALFSTLAYRRVYGARPSTS